MKKSISVFILSILILLSFASTTLYYFLSDKDNKHQDEVFINTTDLIKINLRGNNSYAHRYAYDFNISINKKDIGIFFATRGIDHYTNIFKPLHHKPTYESIDSYETRYDKNKKKINLYHIHKGHIGFIEIVNNTYLFNEIINEKVIEFAYFQLQENGLIKNNTNTLAFYTINDNEIQLLPLSNNETHTAMFLCALGRSLFI